MQRGQLAVGKHEFRILVGVKLDDALGLVDDVSGALQLRYYDCASGEVGQVDRSILQSGVLHRPPGSIHRLKTELGVGDWSGEVRTVHLHQMDTRLPVVEKHQLLDTIPGR